MNIDLLRQRRNLMLVSGVLIIFDFAQVSIAKVSLLGTELLVGKPEVLFFVAWVLWAYFFLRYYQYLRQEEDLKIQSSFTLHLYGLARKYTDLVEVQDNMGQTYRDFRLKRLGCFKWHYALHDYDPAEGRLKEQVSKPIPFVYILLWFFKSLFYVSAHTPKVTEHVAPVLLAVLAPIVSYAF